MPKLCELWHLAFEEHVWVRRFDVENILHWAELY